MKEEFKSSENWAKRFLPHYNAEEKLQMITYRLADSLPQEIMKSIQHLGTPQATAGENSKTLEAHKRKVIEDTLDKGYGSCILSQPQAAMIVSENWKHFHEVRYDLIAYVVMPNHVHILIKVYEGFELSKIVWSWKSYVTRRIFEIPNLKQLYLNSFLSKTEFNLKSTAPQERRRYLKPAAACGVPRKIPLWQREYWDRFIRDENHFQKAIEYIHHNPVKSGLVKHPKDWEYSSYRSG